MKRLALNQLQSAVYRLLTNREIWVDGVPVHNDVPCNPTFPFTVMGVGMDVEKNDAKNADIADYYMPIMIYSKYGGTKEINEIADDIANILGHMPIDLADESFNCLLAEVAEFHSYPEETEGYRGYVVLKAKIQNLKA